MPSTSSGETRASTDTPVSIHVLQARLPFEHEKGAVALAGHARGRLGNGVDGVLRGVVGEQILDASTAKQVEAPPELGLEDDGSADDERDEAVLKNPVDGREVEGQTEDDEDENERHGPAQQRDRAGAAEEPEGGEDRSRDEEHVDRRRPVELVEDFAGVLEVHESSLAAG